MIYLDGKPISDWGLQIQKEHDHPSVGNLRTRTITIPGMDGEWDFGSELGPKPFRFPVGFIEYDQYEKQRKLNDFVAFLFDVYGKPREMKLSFDYEPDKYYLVKVSSGFTPRRIFGLAFFDLPLIANDPFSYAGPNVYDPTEDYQYDQENDFDTNLYFENIPSFQWIYTSHYTGIYNYSHYVTPIKLIINGSCKNIKITHLETEKAISISGAFLSADEIVIDSKTFTIVKNKTVNLLNQYSGDFFQLVEGDNSFLFESETTPSATVTLDWNHRFI